MLDARLFHHMQILICLFSVLIHHFMMLINHFLMLIPHLLILIHTFLLKLLRQNHHWLPYVNPLVCIVHLIGMDVNLLLLLLLYLAYLFLHVIQQLLRICVGWKQDSRNCRRILLGTLFLVRRALNSLVANEFTLWSWTLMDLLIVAKSG